MKKRAKTEDSVKRSPFLTPFFLGGSKVYWKTPLRLDPQNRIFRKNQIFTGKPRCGSGPKNDRHRYGWPFFPWSDFWFTGKPRCGSTIRYGAFLRGRFYTPFWHFLDHFLPFLTLFIEFIIGFFR